MPAAFVGSVASSVWHACTAAGSACASAADIAEGPRCTVDWVQFGVRAASGRLFNCLHAALEQTSLGLHSSPWSAFRLCISIRSREPTKRLHLHLNNSTINILQPNAHEGKLQRNESVLGAVSVSWRRVDAQNKRAITPLQSCCGPARSPAASDGLRPLQAHLEPTSF